MSWTSPGFYGVIFLILSVKTGSGCSSHSLLGKDNYAVMHLGLGNSKRENRLGSKWTASIPKEKNLGLLVDEKMNLSQQCVLVAQKAKCILGCIKRRMTSRARQEISHSTLPLWGHTSSTVLTSGTLSTSMKWSCCVGSEEAMRMTRGLGYLSYEERLREMDSGDSLKCPSSA